MISKFSLSIGSIEKKYNIHPFAPFFQIRFFVCVSDVLTSVQKTEESLRRLKKMRDRGTQSVSAEGRGLTDDDKIRMQLAIDVNSFTQEVC